MALEQTPTEQADERGTEAVSVSLRVNGTLHVLEVEPRVTLLDALREHLRLTGAKKGNICRCAGYPGILAAIRDVAGDAA